MAEAIKPRGSIRVYACGGCGINIGQMLEGYREELDASVAKIEVVYCDTSDSNLTDQTAEENVYLITNTDGSGKIRAENHVAISERIPDILKQFPPLQQNIIICSAAGGTGSIMAPYMAGFLHDQNKPPIVMLVGDSTTLREAENALKTLKSFEGVAKARKKPLVISYVQNSKLRKRAEVDELVRDRILSLAILFSRNNRELDSQDLYNFLRFDRVTRYKDARIAALTILAAGETLDDVGDIISVATLANKGDDTAIEAHIEYQAVGFLPPGTDEGVRSGAPVHFYITDGMFDAVSLELNETQTTINKGLDARVKRGGLLSDDDKPTEHGIVL